MDKIKVVRDVIAPRTHCRAGLHLMTQENVAIKASTRQRYCIACRDAKKQRRRGLFVLGDIWTDEQIKVASLPLLTNQMERLESDLDKLTQRLYSLKVQLVKVKDTRAPKVEQALSSLQSSWKDESLESFNEKDENTSK